MHHPPDSRQQLLHLDEQPDINFLLSAHSFLVFARYWLLAFSAKFIYLFKHIAFLLGCTRQGMLRLFPARALQQPAVPVRAPQGVPFFKRAIARVGMGASSLSTEQARQNDGELSKKQDRQRELLPPPNPSSLRSRHRFRRLPSPRGQCGRRKRGHEHSPTPSAPAPTLNLLTPPRYAVSTAARVP